MTDYLTPSQFNDAVGDLGWRIVGDGCCAFYATRSLAQSADFARRIAELPDVDSHPPDFDIRPDGVTVRLLTRTAEWYGPSQRDVSAAREISRIADEVGLRPDPSAVQSVLVIPGGPATAELMPFWQAILGYERRPDSPEEDLVDPHLRGPAFWFEQMDEPRADGGGAIHIAVWVPEEDAEARVQAALAAGGRMVRDDYAPSWWTLADAAGNECDVASVKGRD
jgi:4a-hydroxytetrahydrobiopterin dehydratase